MHLSPPWILYALPAAWPASGVAWFGTLEKPARTCSGLGPVVVATRPGLGGTRLPGAVKP